MFKSEKIEWKPVPGFPHYFAGSNGIVHREECIISGKHFPYFVFNKNPSTYYYLYVRLFNENGYLSLPVHTVVCMSYHSNPENKPCVNHKDRKIQNNRPDNLEWATRSENSKHWCDFDQKIIDSIPIGARIFIERRDCYRTVIFKSGRYFLTDDQQTCLVEEITEVVFPYKETLAPIII